MRSPDGEIRPRDGSGGPGSPLPRPRPQPRPVGDREPGRPPTAVEPERAATRPAETDERPETGKPEPTQPDRSRAATRKAGAAQRRRRTRTTRTTAAAVLALLALAALFLVPEVRTVLRQSFTRLPQQSIAISFTENENPQIHGTMLEVPVTVRGVNTGLHTYGVKVWTENAAGKVDASTTASIGTAHGVTAGVVSLPVADDAAEVWVSLDGSTQVLHFRIAND